ncbi:family 2 glycosyl transferase [Sulfurovum riftiae]|uniref:Family 2 glycosyl transferase n=1 Tax=Sulfurovum riftiae TaxID=1630136 RepID=A0A151CGB2_9BACT|nr:family 2 glycosyl transferase [Sulfurovum riftiae]
MTTSLVITTYNRPDALQLVLESVLHQRHLPDEIIIADDGSETKTRNLIEQMAERSTIPILHAWQPDTGFRAAMARNRAIAMANGEYIVMIDGDMVLHPDFIQDHLNAAEKGTFIQGGRVLLNRTKTEEVLASRDLTFSLFTEGIENRKNAFHSPLLSRFFSKKGYSLKGIKTCNFSLFRKDILAVNGFDNCFVGWGREDSEFVVRMMNYGIMRKNIKFAAIAYHLYHPENPRQSLPQNEHRLQKSMAENMIRCENGIERFL